MKTLKLTKVIASFLIIALALALNPIGASAEWKQDSTGWWYTEGNSWATGWRNIQGKRYYFDSYGYMVHDTTVDGYYLSSSGAYITNLPNVTNASSFIFDTTTGTITKYTGTDAASVVLPSIINGVPVKIIGEDAFKDNSKLISVTISDSVTTIENHAFEGCSSLTSVTIPLSVKNMDGEAFLRCTNLTNINADMDTVNAIKDTAARYEGSKTTITSQSNSNSYVNLPDATDASSFTFDAATGTITKYIGTDDTIVVLPSVINGVPVKIIGEDAFSGHSEITSITIPNSITSIRWGAFKMCRNINYYVKSESIKQLLINNGSAPYRIIVTA